MCVCVLCVRVRVYRCARVHARASVAVRWLSTAFVLLRSRRRPACLVLTHFLPGAHELPLSCSVLRSPTLSGTLRHSSPAVQLSLPARLQGLSHIRLPCRFAPSHHTGRHRAALCWAVLHRAHMAAYLHTLHCAASCLTICCTVHTWLLTCTRCTVHGRVRVPCAQCDAPLLALTVTCPAPSRRSSVTTFRAAPAQWWTCAAMQTWPTCGAHACVCERALLCVSVCARE